METKSQHQSIHPITPERPIESKDQDTLDRTRYAQSVASYIRRWKHSDNLVISLNGEWGSGKTSLKNLVLEYLREEGNDTPTIVEYNPWYWLNQQQVAEAFFSEIALTLGKSDNKEIQKAAKKWREWGKMFAVAKTTLSGATKVLPTVAIALVLILSLVGIAVEDWITRVVFIFCAIAFASISVVTLSGKFASDIADFFDAKALRRKQNIEDLKRELKAELGNLPQSTLVVIDDIDRLSPAEIALLFQLVKANSDFPKVIYLLLFQRKIVEKALDSTIGSDAGRKYLEKIVQVPLNIPYLTPDQIEEFLLQKLQEIRSAIPWFDQRFDDTDFWGMYRGGIYQYFSSLRDIKRFYSTFSFLVERFTGNAAFEVNPVELFALEVLRVFEPDLYVQIKNSKTLLTRNPQRPASKPTEEQLENDVKNILQHAGVGKLQAAEHILRRLFPIVETGIAKFPTTDYFSPKSLIQGLRICHDEYFDRYFQFTHGEQEISESALANIISLVYHRSAFLDKMQEFIQDGSIGRVLRRLEAHATTIAIDKADSFVPAMFDLGDLLPRQLQTTPGIESELVVSTAVASYLLKVGESNTRKDIFIKALQESSGLAVPVTLLYLEMRREEGKSPPYRSFLLLPEHLPDVKRNIIEKVERLATESPQSFLDHPYFKHVFDNWLQFGDQDRLTDWITQLWNTDHLILRFVFRIGTVQNSDPEKKCELEISPLRNLIDVKPLQEYIGRLDRQRLSQDESFFVDAIERAYY